LKTKKLIIGLTGGIGSGKSTVCQMFRDLGITIIDADQIAREIVAPGSDELKKIIEKFGVSLLKNDNTLNRDALRTLIFNNSSAKKWLEDLLHPVIYQTMIDRAQQADSPYVILDIPLLAETLKNQPIHIREYIDRILVIDTTEALRISRLKNHNRYPEDVIKKIINQQASQKERSAIADDVIENNEAIETLENKVMRLHKQYLGTVIF
jgi:dephospho-CoA kinase